MEHGWNDTVGHKRITRRKRSPSATSSTTNLTYNDLGSNPRFRGERQAGLTFTSAIVKDSFRIAQ